MHKHTLTRLLSSLSRDELRSFEDFVNSPFFNKKSAVVRLFGYLKNLHPHYDDPEKLNRKNIFRTIYPDKNFNFGVMRNTIYELNMLGEKFLELKRYDQSKPDQYRNLLTELMDRNLNKSFKKNFRNADLLLQKDKKSDVYFRNRMDLELLKFNYDIKNAGRTEKSIFDRRTSKLLVMYFLTKFFKINYNNLVHMLNFGKIEHIDFMDEVFSFMRKSPEVDPVINLYYYKFLLMYQEDETSYRKFKQLVKEQSMNLERKELFNTYINLLNYCDARIASGESVYCKDVVEIYDEMSYNNIVTITENDYFDTVLFRLGVESALILRRLSWAKTFIEKYSSKLPPALRQDEVNFALANCFLVQKNFDEAQVLLSRIQLHSPGDKIHYYVLQSKLYYETKGIENLISGNDAIVHFISNDKILSIESKNKFRKFVKYLDYLIKLNTRLQKNFGHSVGMVKKELISEDGVMEKAWLLEKLDGMKKNL